MNYEFKIEPRFEGLENKRELEEVVTQLALAKEAHPKCCDEFSKASTNSNCKWLATEFQRVNNNAETSSGYGVLMEEVMEAFAAIADNDMRHAYTEFAQVATVAIRLMQKIREEWK